MATNNFMAADIRAIFLSCCLFSLIAFGPGYAIGFLLNIMGFRMRPLAGRFALSVALSISLGPVITYFIGRWLSLDAACVFFVGLSVYAAGLVTRDCFRRRTFLRGSLLVWWKVAALVCAWVLIATLSLSDMQIGRRLYFSIIGYDYFVRTSFTAAISHFGIPPPNPFYFPGHPVPLRYHYFWLSQAALIHHAAWPWIDARQAFVGSAIWSGIGLICVLALYLRYFSPVGERGIRQRTMVGVCLLAVTGLDILPTALFVSLAQLGLVKAMSPSVEWWNNQIDGWLYTMLWEPHYIAGLIACLTGFLILWTLPEECTRRQRFVGCVVAGSAFATGVGAALYVAMVFAIFLLCWLIISVSKGWYREALLLGGSGVVALLLSAAFLMALLQPGSGGSFLQVTVRSFSLGEVFLAALGLTHPWQIAIGNAVFLPLNYFLELGFFFVVARIQWVRFRETKRKLTRYELALFTMICVSGGVCTFVKSGVITNNDLGWRGFLPAQFALLILATDMWANRSGLQTSDGLRKAPILTSSQKKLLNGLLVLGAAGVAYDVAILRFFPVLSDAGWVPKIAWLATDSNLGARAYANREAYEWVRAHTGARSVIQQNPTPILQDTFYGLYSNRQTAAEDPSCGTVFGGSPRECGPMVKLLKALFSAEASNLESYRDVCQTLPIDVLIAKDTDAAWANPSSWVWRMHPLITNFYVRVFPCHELSGNLVLTYRGKNRD